jgi:hypothetical protein
MRRMIDFRDASQDNKAVPKTVDIALDPRSVLPPIHAR